MSYSTQWRLLVITIVTYSSTVRSQPPSYCVTFPLLCHIYIYIYIYIYHVLFYTVEIVGNYYSDLFKHSEEPASFLLRNLSSTLPTISAWHASMIIDSNGQSVIIDVKVDFPIRVTTLKKKLRNYTLQLAS